MGLTSLLAHHLFRPHCARANLCRQLLQVSRGPFGLLDQLGVELDPRGNVKGNEHKMTSVPGVFTAGDMTRGQSLVVWAIAEGREAARGIDEYLMGASRLQQRNTIGNFPG